jgi:hypothetical protein
MTNSPGSVFVCAKTGAVNIPSAAHAIVAVRPMLRAVYLVMASSV